MFPSLRRKLALASLVALSVLMASLGRAALQKITSKPRLSVGVWKNISPANVPLSDADHVFCQGLALDPAHPSTLYLCVCAYDVTKGGLYKTTNGGFTWNKIGVLDEPIHLVVDPRNSSHLYCVDGVRGGTLGFWVSMDGGNTWTLPPGFAAVTQPPIGTRDLYSLAVDPADFKHVLVSFHSPWIGTNNCGVLESKDGGNTWSVHAPPLASAGSYGMAIFFLYDPKTSQGDRNTWLFTTQAGGFYRTTDAGQSWTQVSKTPMTHGGEQLYRAHNGVLYAGAYQYPVRSTDNGESWQPLTKGLTYSWYMSICGDGTNLYTGCTNANQPFFTSPESDGLTWTAYGGGVQKFSAMPFEMAYDSVNHILYSANWSEGLLALKVAGK